MTKKISTEDCKAALRAAWPAAYGADSDNWKRVSKSGKKGEPIERVFHHRALPLKAIVVETAGAISAVTLRAVGPWDIDPESELDVEMAELIETPAGHAFLTGHDHFKPGDFYFYVSPKEEDEDVWYFIGPAVCFKAERGYCDHLEPYIGRHLPEGDSEMEECTFVTDRDPETVRADLLARGFLSDPAFDHGFNQG